MNKWVNQSGSIALTAAMMMASLSQPVQAQTNPYGKWGAKSSRPRTSKISTHSPKRGSAERKQIADAMRRDVGQFSGRYVVFNFDHLKISGNWCYAVTRPESPDGKTKYEPISALLRRTNGRWSVAGRLVAEEVGEAAGLRNLRRKFPQAPNAIFVR